MWPSEFRVYVATVPVDMRRGHDGLAAMAREYVGLDPVDGGSLFVFFNRRVDRVKGLWWDGTGMVLFYKRLERGRFRVPAPLRLHETQVEIDAAELELILRGVRLSRTKSEIWRSSREKTLGKRRPAP